MQSCPSRPAAEINSRCPCTGHCTTALGDDVCRSCLRTLDEITQWPALDEEGRTRINRRIANSHLKEHPWI